MDGVIYLAYGRKHIQEAMQSSSQVKQVSSLKTCLITSDDCEEGFDLIKKFNFRQKGHHIKSELYSLSPFDRTLFLDTDTLVLTDLNLPFSKLDVYDFCLVPAPYYRLWDYYGLIRNDYLNLHDDTPMYNSGVMFFRKSENVKMTFRRWGELCKKHQKIRGDQGFLSIALSQTKATVFTLPPNYNFRGFWQLLSGPIRIWHSRWPVPTNKDSWNECNQPYFYDWQSRKIMEINHPELFEDMMLDVKVL